MNLTKNECRKIYIEENIIIAMQNDGTGCDLRALSGVDRQNSRERSNGASTLVHVRRENARADETYSQSRDANISKRVSAPPRNDSDPNGAPAQSDSVPWARDGSVDARGVRGRSGQCDCRVDVGECRARAVMQCAPRAPAAAALVSRPRCRRSAPLSRRLTFQGKGRKCIVTFYEGGISTRLSSIFFNCKMQIKTKCCHAKCDIGVRERVNESAGGRISNFPFVQIMSAERAARRIGASGGVLRAACSVQGQRGDLCPATSYLVSPPPRRRTGWRRPRRVAHSCRGSSTCEATLTRRPHSAQANGIRFLTAEIPPRTFTPRPTEINRSFNTNSTPLWPHWQTDGYFRFSFFRLLLVFARCRCRENKKCLALPLT